MDLYGTRRVMETTSHEVANQYLRFGWNLVNQYVVDATEDRPAEVRFVLASVRHLEDTRELLLLDDVEEVNEHLTLGWRLVDKQVTSSDDPGRRQETIQFVLAWQSEDPPMRPGLSPPVTRELRTEFAPEEQL